MRYLKDVPAAHPESDNQRMDSHASGRGHPGRACAPGGARAGRGAGGLPRVLRGPGGASAAVAGAGRDARFSAVLSRRLRGPGRLNIPDRADARPDPPRLRDRRDRSSVAITGDGTGQTIAIVDAYNDPNIVSDLQVFDSQFSLPACNLVRISQNGRHDAAGHRPRRSGRLLGAGDLARRGMGPRRRPQGHDRAGGGQFGLHQRPVSPPSARRRNYAGVSVVSMSWGAAEFSGESSYDHLLHDPGRPQRRHVCRRLGGQRGLHQPAHHGGGLPGRLAERAGRRRHHADRRLQRQLQFRERLGQRHQQLQNGGSGGGISQYETQPAYQKGVVTQSTTYRTVPDVAFDADPNSGVAVYDSWDYPHLAVVPGGRDEPGGPGVGRPDRPRRPGPGLGGPATLDRPPDAPDIYALPASDFHDITTRQQRLCRRSGVRPGDRPRHAHRESAGPGPRCTPATLRRRCRGSRLRPWPTPRPARPRTSPPR